MGENVYIAVKTVGEFTEILLMQMKVLI